MPLWAQSSSKKPLWHFYARHLQGSSMYVRHLRSTFLGASVAPLCKAPLRGLQGILAPLCKAPLRHLQGTSEGGSPQAELRPGKAPHKQNYVREHIYPQAEFRQGTGRLAGWLAGGITTREPVMRLAGWLAGWGAGWLAESQRGPKRPREAERG